MRMAEAEKRMIQDDIISDDMLMVASRELFKPSTKTQSESCSINNHPSPLHVLGDPKVVGSMSGGRLSVSDDVRMIITKVHDYIFFCSGRHWQS